MLRRLLINKKLLVIVPVVMVLALTGLFLPAKKVSIKPFGMLSIESKITISIGYEAAYANPDTEWQSPDVLIVQTNLTGAVTDIQDDPDSPDANWLTAINDRADTVCRVSFPTPTGNPTVGAGLQEFKIWVRMVPADRAIPTVRIDLYDAGVFKATVLAATSVTSATGQLFSATWDASLLADATGAGVECYIYGTLTDKETVEVGAVEWNVHYTPFPDITNAPTEINFGTVYTSTDYWSKGIAPVWGDGLGDAECTFTITNLTEVPVDIDIRSTHFSDGIASGGWDIGATAGTDVVVLKAGQSGDTVEGDMVTLTTGDLPFIAALAGGSSTKMWELKMETPSSFSNTDPKSALITLTATLSP